MGIAETLAPQAVELALAGDFRTVGAPGLMGTNERTPASFYDELRAGAGLDGYVLGAGCGNVLAMAEAFPQRLLGMVLVDVDPAVVCAGRMLVAGMARHPACEDFVGEIFRGGRAPLAALEREVLESETTPALRGRMERHRERLWLALSSLTDGFSRGGPAAVSTLLAQWAACLPPRGGVVPVRAFLAKNYRRLQPLARRGDIAVVCSSIFHPGLLAAVAALPGFGASRNLIYLSNVVDHALRRTLLAQARRRLGLAGDEDEAAAAAGGRSTGDFAERFEREQVAHLRRLAAVAPGTVCVDATARRRLELRWQLGVPRYTAADLSVDLDLDPIVTRFFSSLAGARSRDAPPGGGARGDPWRRAPRERAAALRLHGAAAVGDELRVRRGLRELSDAAAAAARAAEREPAAPEAFLHAAFCGAELGHAALTVLRTGAAAALRSELDELRDRLEPLVRALAAGAERHRPDPARGAAASLLVAQACDLAGALLGERALRARAGRFLDAGLELQAPALARAGDGAGDMAALAETAVRLLCCDVHARRERVQAAAGRTVATLLQGLGHGGELAGCAAAVPPAAGYEGYYRREEAVYQNARLALVLYGLSAGEATAVEAALRIDHFVRHRGAAPTPETDVLLGARR